MIAERVATSNARRGAGRLLAFLLARHIACPYDRPHDAIAYFFPGQPKATVFDAKAGDPFCRLRDALFPARARTDI
jgi:hypothetical protein